MSFILDALKKSEAERSRGAGPALINMRIMPPRRRMPLWVIVLTLILLANFAVLAIVLLRPQASPLALPAPTVSVSPAAAPPPAVSASTAAPANVLPPPVLLPQAQAMQPSAAPPMGSPPAAQPREVAPVAARDDEAQLPDATELRLAGIALPELRLALHVYDSKAASRYVLLNSRRLVEGEGTGDGLVLERVTPTGVVLSFNGQRFRLLAGQ